ncbi:MAG: response regulator, partial [Thermodesulfobacteriota bacterium]
NELVVQIDTDFVINLNNRASSEMLNIPRDEFSGRKCFSLFYDREDICPDCPAMEAMRSGKQVDVLRYRPDGHILARSVYPVFDDDGTISGATILASDVTEEKDAEKKLKDALEDSRLNARKLESMFRAAKIVLKMENFQEAARHIFDSAAELTGATSGYVALLSRDGEENELLFLESGGRPCSVDPDLPMPVRGFRAEAYLQNKVVYDNDFARSKWMRFMPRGHMRLDNVLFAPLVVEGKTLGIIGLANKDGGFTDEDARTAQAFGDLAAIALRNSKTIAMLVESERAANKAAEIADTANRAKSEFLANMSHEIRTPLNGILGMIQLMQTTALNGEQEEYVDMAHKSTKRLNRLLTDILDLSRIEAGKMEIREDPFDIGEVLESIEDIFVHTARKNNNTIKVVMDENVPKRLLGDSTRLTEILFNLVGNACKYTNDGQIEVELVKVNDSRKDVNRLLFLVSDNGSGIPDEKISQVFETFTQANDSESPFTRQYEGAGLGLALVKRLVELMGGNVAIDSEPGKGTAVYVNLPFRICETDKSRAARRIESEHAVPPQGRILLVDDDSITRLHGQRLLEKVGYEVEIAENGMAALDRLAQGSYGCVLMDVQMPVMDGVEATKKIRASHAGYKDIPVIAMTAFAMVGDREKFLDAGMDDYISKPVNKDELLAVLEKNIS